MRTNSEIRRAARQVLKAKWLWRLATVGLCLYGIQNLVLSLLARAYAARGIPTLMEYWQKKLSAWQQGLDYALPTAAARGQLVGSVAFELFITYVFASIASYGFARVLLKSTADREEGWFADSFDGFRRPLETTWLMALMNIRIALWSLLFFAPGIVALYRYRLAWYLKSENPAWSAGRCLKESGRQMAGHKEQAFFLDLSYLGWLVGAGFVLGVGTVLGQVGGALAAAGAAVSAVGMLLLVFVLVYLFVGRTVFYGELKEKEAK